MMLIKAMSEQDWRIAPNNVKRKEEENELSRNVGYGARPKDSWRKQPRLRLGLIISGGILAGAISALGTPVFGQQFGLRMGQSASQIRSAGVKLVKVQEGRWKASYLPYGNRMFDDYRLVISPKSGLCKITAWISEIEDTSYGDRTREKYLTVLEALTKRYGYGRRYDFLRTGAIWKNHNEWMWSLFKEERYLSAFWGSEEGGLGKENLKAIKLEAHGTSPSTSMISVSYEFKNFGECSSELKELDSSNL